LMVEDSAGNRAYSIVDVLLGGPPVITSMSISPNPTYVGQYTYFYATGDDPDGSIVNWHWDFGDGYTWDSSYPGAYHYYYTLGTYNVTVTARDNDGLETSASMLLQVIDQPPYACFYVYPNPTVVEYPTNFQSCSWDRDGYIVSSEWDFGDARRPIHRHLDRDGQLQRQEQFVRFPVCGHPAECDVHDRASFWQSRHAPRLRCVRLERSGRTDRPVRMEFR